MVRWVFKFSTGFMVNLATYKIAMSKGSFFYFHYIHTLHIECWSQTRKKTSKVTRITTTATKITANERKNGRTNDRVMEGRANNIISPWVNATFECWPVTTSFRLRYQENWEESFAWEIVYIVRNILFVNWRSWWIFFAPPT